MRQCLGLMLLAAGVLFVGLAFAKEPPSGPPDDPPVRLKKKNKPAPDKADEPAKPPMKDDKKEPPKKVEPKEAPEPATPPEDEAEVLKRVAKNVQLAEEKLANKELNDGTRQLQDDILKDLDSLIRAAESPPPSGGGGGGEDEKQDPSSGSKSSSKGSSGSMGKQGRSSAQSGRSARAARRQQNKGSQQANKGGSGNEQPKDQGTQQTNKNSTGNQGGGGGKSMEGPNKNADLYKDVWGHLPEALRAEMNAYSNDKQFMAKYDELIKRYYRTIAEQGRKKGGD